MIKVKKRSYCENCHLCNEYAIEYMDGVKVYICTQCGHMHKN